MQGFRTRVKDTILRRSSFSSTKEADQSGTESENVNVSGQSPNRASTDKDKDSIRQGTYDSGSIKARARKRLSLSFRGRRGTSDASEHSQLAQQVVAEINADEVKKMLHVRDDDDLKPAAAVVAATSAPGAEQGDSTEGTKVDSSPVDSDVKDDKKPQEVNPPVEAQEPTPEAKAEEPVAEEPKVQVPVVTEPAEEPITTHEVDETVPSTNGWPTQSRVDGLGESYHVIMHGSPARAPVSIAVEEPAPSFPEPVPYDASFASSTSGTDNYSAPTPLSMSMPVPRPMNEPLSAIDELHAKTHPLAQPDTPNQVKDDETQPLKEDPNYDADEYVRVMSLFFLLPAFLFLGIPYFFPQRLVEFAAL